MKKIVISGGKELNGQARVLGAKNSLLPILAAVLLQDGECVINNCPPLTDVVTMLEILKSIGCTVEHRELTVRIDTRGLYSSLIDDSLMHKLRSSIFILGPLIARLNNAEIGYPGGCDIGIRPIDLHLKGLKELGVNVTEADGRIICSGKLTGAEVYLDYPSVGATENVMMAASLADGATVIVNPAKEPEIVDLEAFINAMGGRVSGAGTGRIVVHGVKKLTGCEYSAMPDRIVSGTLMIACAASGGEIFVENARYEHLLCLAGKLKENGCTVEDVRDGILIKSSGRRRANKVIETMPYPGFPTDLQSPMMALQAISRGTSVIVENVFENRFRLAGELKKMGADITVKDRMAVIRGVERLNGATVDTYDLRSGAALIIAGLAAEGITVVRDKGLINRGYYKLEEQLKGLGAEAVILEE